MSEDSSGLDLPDVRYLHDGSSLRDVSCTRGQLQLRRSDKPYLQHKMEKNRHHEQLASLLSQKLNFFSKLFIN